MAKQCSGAQKSVARVNVCIVSGIRIELTRQRYFRMVLAQMCLDMAFGVFLRERLGSFLQQLAPEHVEQLRIRYYGKIVDLDALPLTRAIQRGYLLQISEHINDVNAPKKLAALGIEVEVVKSSSHAEYTELVEAQVVCRGGKTRTIGGTLFGKNQLPRIVTIDDHSVEVNPRGTLLVLKNRNVPGIVGFIGTALGDDKVNIANMSLSLDRGQGFAVSVFELDSAPSQAASEKISTHPAIEKYRIIEF